jgi:hypothetical protein
MYVFLKTLCNNPFLPRPPPPPHPPRHRAAPVRLRSTLTNPLQLLLRPFTLTGSQAPKHEQQQEEQEEAGERKGPDQLRLDARGVPSRRHRTESSGASEAVGGCGE